MASFSVTAKSNSFEISITIPAVSGSGHKFDALSYKTVVTPGKAADKDWIKAHAKGLEVEITRQLNADVRIFEAFRTTLLKDENFAKQVKKEAQSKKLDEKSAQAFVETLIGDEMSARWERLHKPVGGTFPMGIRAAYDKLLKAEDATLSKALTAQYKDAISDYSKRPLVTIAATTAAAIAGIVTGAGPVAMGLAALGGIVSLASTWIKHRKEVALNVAAVQNAEGALRTSVEQAEKALDTALKAIATLEIDLGRIVAADALKSGGELNTARGQLSKADSPEAKKALDALQKEVEARDKFLKSLAAKIRTVKESKAALGQAQGLVAKVLKDTKEGADESKAALALAEKMQNAVDDALKFVKAALSVH